jgi:hypothetical protein
MVDFIQTMYPGLDFVFDKTVGVCSKRRPDAFLDLLTHVLIIECDENQHQDYNTSCEIARLNEIFTDFAYRPIVFIRFNPDAYTRNGKKTLSSFINLKVRDVPTIRNLREWNLRLNSLKESIDKYLVTPKDPKLITNVNLFFNE